MKFLKNIFDFIVKDKDGNPSITRTAFFSGFVVVNAKLLISGMTIGGLTMSAFTGGEYAAALSALGGVYILRRSKNIVQPPKPKNKKGKK